MGAAKLRKMTKIVVKNNQNNLKTRKLMLLDQETLEPFLKKVAQYLVRKKNAPKKMVELSDDE